MLLKTRTDGKLCTTTMLYLIATCNAFKYAAENMHLWVTDGTENMH